METKLLEKARTKRQERLQELAVVGPLIVGSLARVGVRCGNPNCRCARGERHTAYVLTSKVRGKTKTVHVPAGMVEEVRAWVEEHRRLKRLVKEISALSEELVRGHVRAGRAARAIRQSPRRIPSKRS
jgi:hypothetical protein